MNDNTAADPLVSVILCVYNGGPYLPEAIESTRAQTESDFELLIVDNGSTDETPNVLHEYAKRDRRIRIQRCERVNVATARNLILRDARGEFMAVMDADDISEPDRFAAEIAFLREHPDHVAVGSSLLIIDPESDALSVSPRPERHEEILESMLLGDGVLPHPSAMVRMDAVRRIGGYREHFDSSEDLDLWLRLTEIGKLANLPQPLLRYRQHFQSETSARRITQLEFARLAVHDACRRMGRTPSEQLLGSCRKCSVTRTLRQWSRMAFRAGYHETAWKHIRRALRRSPLSLATWALAIRLTWATRRPAILIPK